MRHRNAVALGILSLGLTLVAVMLLTGLREAEAAALATSCDIKASRKLADGGEPAWSPDGQSLAYHRWDAARVYQLRIMSADGSNDRCLSCVAAPGSPQVNRHKVHPTWHASGRFMVLQSEIGANVLSWDRSKLTSELYINGMWMNLYAVTPDGQQWYRLTDYPAAGADGAMMPYFSADGSKLLWSRLVRPASATDPWGAYRLMLADFVIDDSGKPSLQNIRDLTPSSGGSFFESHGFSPDGRTVIFASDREARDKWAMELWKMDLASGALTNLTKSHHFEEHASYSPDGKKIAFMSSAPYDWLFITYQTELMLMNPDGSNERLLTHFNVSGFPDSAIDGDRKRSMPMKPAWSPDGTRMALTRQLSDWDYPTRQLWLLTFNGPCGTDQSSV